ncbi:DUF2798 domain-containing protein [Phaeobacter sp. PT47_59]|uniref:DUF2798 domain-containing protein n=1 Tax=Phaeobacter sp. PT47_59 TaxID=3029979 RepID=UPI00238044E4|nr:DUF2798 domain-containing protein [Phaeobacter sp. PT47_59]MDE4175127.1 DUF2798 domain-containing protein [Phaeobacter sp. PT47_59]
MPHTKATVLLAQFFIALIMAFLMTGIFTGIPTGFAPGWVSVWLQRFVIAMPIAFVLSLAVGPIGFFLASRLIRILMPSRDAG